MVLSGLDIYKLLPKTNCRKCGFPTCLAFAMQLAKKAVAIDSCPFVSPEAKAALEAQAQPPIKPVKLGTDGFQFEIGNETVMFRHEEKFRNPAGIGFIIEDSLNDQQIIQRLGKINQFKFERVGQLLQVNLVAIKQTSGKQRFLEAVKLVKDNTALALMLMSNDPSSLKQAAHAVGERRPLLYCATEKNYAQVGAISKELQLPLVVSADKLDSLSRLTKELNAMGVNELILDTGSKTVTEKIWDLTQLRRQALKKSNRSLGYPALAIVDKDDPYEEAMEAAAYIAKYAGIVLIEGIQEQEVISILTLRQNIYTDPQKPLQVEPKLYPVGQVNQASPVLITTNFSLSYYTVLGEVEASRIPAYILSVDTQGMSVLTAWAAEKFNAECITKSLSEQAVREAISHKNLIIPGYVAVISGELAESSGFEVIVGPKEASGIPAFLKNLKNSRN